MPVRNQYLSVVLKLTWALLLSTFVTSTAVAQPGVGSGQPFVNYRFMVEIAGMGQMSGFFSVDGLNWHTEVITYTAGDGLTETKLPGRTTYSAITLKRGYSGSDVLWDWYKDVINGNVQKKSGSIIILDAANQEVKRYNFFEGWPSHYRIRELDSMKPGVLSEEIEIVVSKIEPA
jgi:phage tail-like protein